MTNETESLLVLLLESIIIKAINKNFIDMKFVVNINPQFKLKGVKSMIITNEQFVDAIFEAKTLSGNPARLDGAPVVSSSDPAVASVELVNENTIRITAVGLGQCIISVKADADLDEGEVREIEGILDITVVEAEASAMTLTAGEPEQK
jgi:hypothetical protein